MPVRTFTRRFGSYAVICIVLWLWLAHGVLGAPQAEQESYASPEEAAAALAAAARSHDQAASRAILGPNSERLLSSGDRYADVEQQNRFAAAYDEKHVLVPDYEERMILDVGDDDWPLPIPIVQRGRWHRWVFDAKAGADELVDRRIGRDELAAIRVALSYVDAQKAYFERMKQQTGTGFYAERLISTAGRRDGLYWPAAAGTSESPFGPLVAQAEGEGYPGAFVGGTPIPYQGYYFRVLKGQGPNAPGGAISYMKSRRMTGGFALIAWPAIYGSSGIMAFQVHQEGVVFEKDLGAKTSRIAAENHALRSRPDLDTGRGHEPVGLCTDSSRRCRNASSTVPTSINGAGFSPNSWASARTRSDRATMPTSLPSRTTGTRLMFLACMSRAISRASVSSVTVVAPVAIIDFTLRFWS